MKDDLISKLQQKGLTMKGQLVNLQRAATAQGIALEEEVTKVVKGWVGKPKGLLQVLWERGFVDPTITNPYKHYTINGTKKNWTH